MALARSRRYRRDDVSPAPFAALILHAAVAFVQGAGSRLMPWWAEVAVWLVWLVGLVRIVRWWEPAPRRTPWVPVAQLGFFVALAVIGAALLDW